MPTHLGPVVRAEPRTGGGEIGLPGECGLVGRVAGCDGNVCTGCGGLVVAVVGLRSVLVLWQKSFVRWAYPGHPEEIDMSGIKTLRIMNVNVPVQCPIDEAEVTLAFYNAVEFIAQKHRVVGTTRTRMEIGYKHDGQPSRAAHGSNVDTVSRERGHESLAHKTASTHFL